DISPFAFREEVSFYVIDQQTEEEDAALQKLLGIPKLFEAFAEQISSRPKNEVRVFASLTPVGRTSDGEIVAAACQLAVGPKGVQDGRWVGFFVEPEHYHELQASVEKKVNQYRDFLANSLGGVSGMN